MYSIRSKGAAEVSLFQPPYYSWSNFCLSLKLGKRVRWRISSLVIDGIAMAAPVHLLYATSTGTAEDVAEVLAERLLTCGVSVLTCSTLDDYPLAQLLADTSKGDLFIFIVATSGDGQVPFNMRRFWQFIRRSDLPPSVLSSMKYAVFGLGDRSYVKFNAAARRLVARLCDLGASLILPLALGDDSSDGGYEKELLPWSEKLLYTITSSASIRTGRSETLVETRITVKTYAKEAPDKPVPTCHDKWLPGQALHTDKESVSPAFNAVVLSNHLLTNPKHLSDDKEVRHIELDVSQATKQSGFLDYEPGDIVHVMPRNKVSVVDAFFELTKFDPFDTVEVTKSKTKTRFARYPSNIRTPCTLRDFVSAQLDLTASPRRRFFERLAPFATSPIEKEKLLELASSSGAETLAQYSYREKRTILMALRDFPSARPPLNHLLDMVPVLKSRPFSIASSSLAHPGRIHICASIVKFRTVLRFFRVGVCSSFFLRLEEGDFVPILFEKGTCLRFDETKPSILIGPGTGVAPLRSFLFSVKPGGPQKWLFFGSRCKDGDYLYDQDWRQLLRSSKLTELTTAFSRADEAKKCYVQDKMLSVADRIWELLAHGNGKIYIAGSAGSMPKDIRKTLLDICQSEGKMPSSDSEHFVRGLETCGRLQMECW